MKLLKYCSCEHVLVINIESKSHPEVIAMITSGFLTHCLKMKHGLEPLWAVRQHNGLEIKNPLWWLPLWQILLFNYYDFTLYKIYVWHLIYLGAMYAHNGTQCQLHDDKRTVHMCATFSDMKVYCPSEHFWPDQLHKFRML